MGTKREYGLSGTISASSALSLNPLGALTLPPSLHCEPAIEPLWGHMLMSAFPLSSAGLPFSLQLLSQPAAMACGTVWEGARLLTLL